MITVVETQQFISKTKSLMDEAEKNNLIDFIAGNPQMGDIIPRTGGVRKLRYAKPGRGKSSGYRVIYYFYNDNSPILLFTIYGKNEKHNLTSEEERVLYKIIQQIKKEMNNDE